jgi:uncharacterized protein (DUF2225 family)
MKLMCPYCGLKGTADDALLEKKVRCPQCQKVFRLQQENIPTAAAGSSSMNVGDAEVQRLEGSGVLTSSEVSTCSVCGFSLSADFLERRGDRIFCRICLPKG